MNLYFTAWAWWVPGLTGGLIEGTFDPDVWVERKTEFVLGTLRVTPATRNTSQKRTFDEQDVGVLQDRNGGQRRKSSVDPRHAEKWHQLQSRFPFPRVEVVT